MGKSARSKSKIRNRNVMREKLFGPAQAERIKRLAEKQRVKEGNMGELMETDADAETKEASKQEQPTHPETQKDSSAMETDDKELRERKKSKASARIRAKSKRVTVRNKKGRVMSKNVVKWTKQKRFKA